MKYSLARVWDAFCRGVGFGFARLLFRAFK
jgi:hypothetical protein